MTKKQQVRDEAKRQLREHLHEGSQVFVIVRSKSRMSFSKGISLYTFTTRTDAGYHASKDNPKAQPLTLTYWVAQLMGYSIAESPFGSKDMIRVDDYPQEFVCHLSQALFGIDKASALDCEVL